MESLKRTAIRIRPKSRPTVATPGRICIFTSVDGSLLDAATFDSGASRAAIERLRLANIQVIPISVMTLEEIAPIAAELGLRQAMVIEAGGAIARWKDDNWDVEPCGPPAETFLDVIAAIEDRSGANLLVYSAMEDADAAQVSGRSGSQLHASAHRCFSEPFLIESGDAGEVANAAAEFGFALRRGRRFYHLCRECDEGEAFVRLREELSCDVAIAVGSSPIDAEFLARADVAIIIPAPDGTVDAELLARVPDAHIAHAAGPDGWAAAVEHVVRATCAPKKRARRVAAQA